MIGTEQLDDNRKLVILAMALVVIAAAWALVANKLTLGSAVAVVAGIIIFTFSFVSQEIALYILLLSMLLGPQFAFGGGADATSRGRGITLRFDDFLLVVIGIAWFLRVAINKDLGLFLRTPLNRPIALYLFACALSTANGVNDNVRLNPTMGFFFVLKYFEYFIVYFMAANHLRNKDQIRRFVITMFVVCFLVCLYAISEIPHVDRVSAPFEGEEGEPNTLGGYLILLLSLAIGILATKGSFKSKLPLLALIPFMLVVLAATQSRGSWVALPLMMLTLIYFCKNRLVIIIPLLLVMAVSPFFMPKTVIDRAMYTFKQPEEEGQLKIGVVKIDTSTSARVESWRLILTQDFAKRPLLGYGITGYSFVDAQYMKVLIDTGIIGFISFCILIGTAWRMALRAHRSCEDPLFQGIVLGYLGGFAGLLVHALGANTFIIVRIMEPFWFLTAMVILMPQIEQGRTAVLSKLDTMR